MPRCLLGVWDSALQSSCVQDYYFGEYLNQFLDQVFCVVGDIFEVNQKSWPGALNMFAVKGQQGHSTRVTR